MLERANLLGLAWAQRARDEFRCQQRPIAGGWPGTLREARAQVRASLTTREALGRFGRLTAEEHESAARTTYARARNEWLSSAAPDVRLDGDLGERGET